MGAIYCGEGGVNQPQHLQKYPTADDTPMADQEGSASWSKRRAGRCRLEGESYLYLWGHPVLFIPLRVPFSANTSNDVTVSC